MTEPPAQPPLQHADPADRHTDTPAAREPGAAPAPPAQAPEVSDRYFDAALTLLRRVRDEERASVRAAAAAVADALQGDGRVFVFGAGHSALPAQDVVYRAGGLAPVNLLAIPGATGVDVVPATLGSALERVEGLAAAALRTSPARRGDVLFVISLSGRNTLPVEMAREARALGMTVIGVTSVVYAEQTTSRAASGTFLKDHCDVVLDSKIAVGDGELRDDAIPAPFAPASTVVTSALMQAVMATAATELAARGTTPPMIRSGNVDGGLEWNARIFHDYRDRIFFCR